MVCGTVIAGGAVGCDSEGSVRPSDRSVRPEVPNVTGLSENRAKKELERAGLRSRVVSPPIQFGGEPCWAGFRVSEQSPEGGARLGANSRVSIRLDCPH